MEKKVKVFLDSNILSSVAYSGKDKSRSYLLFELQKMGLLNIYISPLVYEEASLNIRLKKPDKQDFLEELAMNVRLVENIFIYKSLPQINSLPENDGIILLTAVYHKMDFFLTGNERDFSKLYNQKIDKTLILKPSDFLYRRFL